MENIKKYLPVLLLLIAVYFTFFWRLDGAMLWRDEATTACWGREMVTAKTLVPKVWNGKQLIVQGSKGHDFNEKFMPSMHSWLQFYVVAIAFKLFGATTFTARLLFALCAAFGIYLFYLIFRILFQSHRLALIGVFIALFSVHYLHYARQCRYYALVLLISLLIILEFVKILQSSPRGHPVMVFVRLGLFGFLLFNANYFTFGLMWAGLFAGLLVVRNRRFALGFLATSAVLLLVLLPLLLGIHRPFIARAEITTFFPLSSYWDWFCLVYQRVKQLLPPIALFLLGLFFIKRFPRETAPLKRVALWLWTVLLTTMVAAVFINKSNAFLRYYLYLVPVSVILTGIHIFWAYTIFGKTRGTILLCFLFLYHVWTPAINQSEAVVKRQFLKDDSFNGPMIDFLEKNVAAEEKVAFIKNDKGMVAYFYLPQLNWVGILESENPFNAPYKDRLPGAMFDDYGDVDWIVVWGMKGLPVRVESGYELVWNHRFGEKRQETVSKKIFTPRQYTITMAEDGFAGSELNYYDFYKRI
jgi:hypothetical protein